MKLVNKGNLLVVDWDFFFSNPWDGGYNESLEDEEKKKTI